MPILDIPEKVCSHCNGTRWYTQTTKGVLIQTCAVKKNEYNKKWRVKFPEKAKAISKRSKDKVKDTDEYKKKNRQRVAKWNKANPEKTKFKIKMTHLRHKERYDDINRKADKRLRETLHHCYIVRLIRANTPLLHSSDIPQDLIELKRQQLLLIRQLKNNGETQNSNNSY